MITGPYLRDEGIEQVMSSEEAWAEEIGVAFHWWLKNCAAEEFTFEQFRMFVQGYGVPEPHHPNVWGGLAKRFAYLIEPVGHAMSVRPKAHARLTRTYRRAPSASHQ